MLFTVAVSAIFTAAIVFLLLTYGFSVMRIYGDSMSPALFDGDVVIARKTSSLERGDICIFSKDGSFLCKRVVGLEGDEISVDEDGVVSVNGEELSEPYLNVKNAGNSTVDYPVIVPENSYFVMGDNRKTSIDSRSAVVGCVDSRQVKGKLLIRILPTPAIPE